MNNASVPTTAETLLSRDEISRASNSLIASRDRLLEVASGLFDLQSHYKPAPDHWSIAEIIEHLAIIEDRVHGIVGRMPEAPSAEPDRDSSAVEKMILARVPDRSEKIVAPPPVQPLQHLSLQASLSRFREGRVRTVELLGEAPALRGHVVAHPILGPLDGYEWILAVACHTDRHIKQILEVKASSGFPEARDAGSVPLN